MKRLFSQLFWAVIALVSARVAHAAPGRLPDDVQPRRYAIRFAPDLPRGTFAGREQIGVEIVRPTARIVLHAADLTINEARVIVGGRAEKLEVRAEPASETVVLTAKAPIAAGPATIELAWEGALGRELRGLYLAESEGQRYAFTQLEATDARRAFPCFDEPALKARFAVSAAIDPAHVAISNGRVVSETLEGGRKVVTFAETLPMSTYLVALAVGPLEKAETGRGPVPVNVWTTPGKKHLGGYARKTAEALLDVFARYFGVPYPYGKLDLVGVPDFAAGAMENTGAIFFREARLLVDEKTASLDDRRGVALIIAHEMAHQWFGDLVTMAWWDDLWLNEAFATWMELKAIDAIEPKWDVWLDFEGWKAHAFAVDELRATHPIRVPVQTPEEVSQSFDSITYAKGASVLRMLEAWLGEAAFRRGVSAYIKAHAHGNATAEDLWRALARESKQPVQEVATSWFEQPGFPLVSVETRCVGGTTEVTLGQARFFSDAKATAQTRWAVPVCLKAGGKVTCELLREPTKTVRLARVGCGQPVVANPRRVGFYRVAYGPRALAQLAKVQRTLEPAERVALIADTWALVLKGAMPLQAWMDLAAAEKGARSQEVIEQLVERLAYLDDHLVGEAERPAFRAFVAGLLEPIERELGWAPRRGEPEADGRLRGAVLRALGQVARSERVVAEARARLPGVLADPASVDPAVGAAVIAIAARAGGVETYEALVRALKASKAPTEQARILYALPELEADAAVAKVLALVLGPDVRVQDATRLLARLFRNRAARAASWAFVKRNVRALEKRSPARGLSAVVGATGHFCDEGDAKEVESFFRDNRVAGADRALEEAVETIRVCAAFKAREAAGLSAWLAAHGPKHAERALR